MKNYRAVLMALLLSIIFAGCTGLKSGVKGTGSKETRLINRVENFEEALLTGDNESLWEMRSSSFKKTFTKGGYFEYLAGQQGAAKANYNDEYSLKSVSIKDGKATVVINQTTKANAAGNSYISPIFNLWVYEDSDWFLSDRGPKALTEKKVLPH